MSDIGKVFGAEQAGAGTDVPALPPPPAPGDIVVVSGPLDYEGIVERLGPTGVLVAAVHRDELGARELKTWHPLVAVKVKTRAQRKGPPA